MNTSLNFGVEELIKLNDEITNARSNIKSNFTNIKGCFDDLKSNVTGTQINNLITTISDSIINIDTKMDASFQELDAFLTGQMQNYTSTYEGAVALLEKALNKIENVSANIK